MVRNNYARYFHEDFFENSGSATHSNDNIDIPTVAKTRDIIKVSTNKDFYEHKEELEEKAHSQEQKAGVLFNKAPNFFETSYHTQKIFWTALIILALLPIFKSGFVTLISLSQNFSKNIELNKIQNKLKKDTIDIKSKLTSYHSQSGMKRTIKEEIKVIEQNEILIKIVK